MGRSRAIDCINALGSLGICCANGAMMVLMVVFGGTFCNYSYAFSLSLSIYGAAFFYVLFVVLHRRWNPLVPLHDFRRRDVLGVLHRQGFCTGVAWSVNYALLLVANPFVPGLLQLVINGSGLVFVVFLSLVLLGNRYSVAQWLCVIAVAIGGSLAMMDESESDGDAVWVLAYAVGAWSVGLANLLTENVMRNVRRAADSCEEPGTPLVSAVQFLCVSKLYGVPATLALAWLPRAAQGAAWSRYLGNGMRCLWLGVCSEEDRASCADPGSEAAGLSAMWIASTLSFVTILLAAGVQRQRDAVYVGVAHSLAPVLSTIVLTQEGLMGVYYRSPRTFEVFANAVTLGGGVVYTAVTLVQERRAPRTTCLSRSFRFEPLGEVLDSAGELSLQRDAGPRRPW